MCERELWLSGTAVVSQGKAICAISFPSRLAFHDFPGQVHKKIETGRKNGVLLKAMPPEASAIVHTTQKHQTALDLKLLGAK